MEPSRPASRRCATRSPANFETQGDVGASVARHRRRRDGRRSVGRHRPPIDDGDRGHGRTTRSSTSGRPPRRCRACRCLMLADRGELDLYEPIATYWPEFAAAGKEQVATAPRAQPLRRAVGMGRAARRGRRSRPRQARRRLHAAQAPWWEPGIAVRLPRDHPGLPARRGRPAGHRRDRSAQFFADEVAGPLGADFHIGTASGTRRTHRPRDPARRTHSAPTPVDRRLDRRPDARHTRPLDAAVLVDQGLAPRRDPRRRRPRQRPLGRRCATPRPPTAARSTARPCCPRRASPGSSTSSSAAIDLVLGADMRARHGLRPARPDAAAAEPAYLLLGRMGRLAGDRRHRFEDELQLRDEPDGRGHHRRHPRRRPR